MLLSGNKLNKKPTQEQLKLLLRYYQTGKFNDAEKLAISVTKKFPDHHFAWKVLGTVLSQSGPRIHDCGLSRLLDRWRCRERAG